MYCWPLESIESRSCCNSIGTHVFKQDPVTNLQLWHVTTLNNTIQAITRWSPYAAGVAAVIWFRPLKRRVSLVWQLKQLPEVMSWLMHAEHSASSLRGGRTDPRSFCTLGSELSSTARLPSLMSDSGYAEGAVNTWDCYEEGFAYSQTTNMQHLWNAVPFAELV